MTWWSGDAARNVNSGACVQSTFSSIPRESPAAVQAFILLIVILAHLKIRL